MPDRNDDFYQSLRKRIRTWLDAQGKNYKYADYLLFAPDLFHLLACLILDKRIPAEEKVKLAGPVAYFIAPIDLIPEAVVGPAGYIDDIALAAYVLNCLINAGHGDVAGDGSVAASATSGDCTDRWRIIGC